MTIVGLARTGLAAAKALLAKGAKVTITDSEVEEKLRNYMQQLPPEVEFRLGGHPDEVFTDADVIIPSPGVPLNIAPIVQAQAAGIKIMSEIELAYRFTEVPIIGITGTNGKTTTTTIIGQLLNAAGKKTFVGGNIGVPLVEEALSPFKKDFWVAELSSFQLESIILFRPHIAVLLNVTPDHLDRYNSFEEYLYAKAQVFSNQTPDDFAALNADDELVEKLAPTIRAKKIFFSRRKKVDEGTMIRNNWIVGRFNGQETKICSLKKIRLKGKHNLENLLAAAAVGMVCGIAPEVIAKCFEKFEGLEHRLEPVANIKGIQFVNDSKATNIGAAIKSLESFDTPVILIAGGKDKGTDYAPLVRMIRQKCKEVILIGQAKNKIRQALGGFKIIKEAETLEDAVGMAFADAELGEVVLLSPACSSFDMFIDFEHRGKVFKEAINALI